MFAVALYFWKPYAGFYVWPSFSMIFIFWTYVWTFSGYFPDTFWICSWYFFEYVWHVFYYIPYVWGSFSICLGLNPYMSGVKSLCAGQPLRAIYPSLSLLPNRCTTSSQISQTTPDNWWTCFIGEDPDDAICISPHDGDLNLDIWGFNPRHKGI